MESQPERSLTCWRKERGFLNLLSALLTSTWSWSNVRQLYTNFHPRFFIIFWDVFNQGCQRNTLPHVINSKQTHFVSDTDTFQYIVFTHIRDNVMFCQVYVAVFSNSEWIYLLLKAYEVRSRHYFLHLHVVLFYFAT